MLTVKELRTLVRSYGLPGCSKFQNKDALLRAIGEARAAEWKKQFRRAQQTGRYPAVRGDIDNPHKKWQRARELRQLEGEVDTALLAEGVRKRTTPTKRIEALRKIGNRRFPRRDEPLARSIVREGPRLLEELGGEREGEVGGRRVWR